MKQWWNDTDRGKLKYWEKNIIVWVVDGWMSVERWWNDTDRGKLKYWEKNIILCVCGRWMDEYGALVE